MNFLILVEVPGLRHLEHYRLHTAVYVIAKLVLSDLNTPANSHNKYSNELNVSCIHTYLKEIYKEIMKSAVLSYLLSFKRFKIV